MPEPTESSPSPRALLTASPSTRSTQCVSEGETGVHTRAWQGGKLVAEGFATEDVSEWLAKDDTYVWVGAVAPTRELLDGLAGELGLHPLAVEDALNPRQRPKLDRYTDHLFVSGYSATLETNGELTTHELAVFATERALITIRKGDAPELEPLLARWDGEPVVSGAGVGGLLHGVLDLLVDGHFETVEALDTELENMEALLFDAKPRSEELQKRSFEVRKSLVELRRVVLPMREVVNSLMRRDVGLVSEELRPYYQDLYDHVLRASEWTESLRDLVTTILETNLTLQGNRLNEVMRKLTSWAAILGVVTAVTGFYGQNVPYPGFGKEWGLYCSVGIMVAISGMLYVMFKKRGWL